MSPFLHSLFAICVACLWASQNALATTAPTSAGSKWEDDSRSTKLEFKLNVGGTTFDMATETLFQGEAFSTVVTITSSRNAWIGVMLGSRMVGSTAIIGLDAATAANAAFGFKSVDLYKLNDQSGNTQRDCVPIANGLENNGIKDATFAIVGGKSVLNFTIAQAASSQAFPILGATPGSKVLLSFVTGNNQVLEYHLGYTFQNVALSTVPGGGGVIATDAVKFEVSYALAYHIVFMIMAWIFILPAGAAVALTRVRRGPNASKRWFKIHRGLQMGGVAIGLGGWVSGIVHLQDFGTPHLSKGHHNFGYAIGVLSLIQLVNGLMRPHAPEQGEAPTKERSRWYLSHRSLGCLLLLSGITNSIVGAGELQDVAGGEDNIVVFPGTDGIVVKDLVTITLALGIVAYIGLLIATIVDPCRRRREARNGTLESPSSPTKPLKGNNGMDFGNSFGAAPRENGYGGQQNNQYGGGGAQQNNTYGGGGGGMGFGQSQSSPYGGGNNDNHGYDSQPGYVQAPPPRSNMPAPYGGGGAPSLPPRAFSPPAQDYSKPPPRAFSPPPQEFSQSAYGGGGGGYKVGRVPEPNTGVSASSQGMYAPAPNSGFQLPPRPAGPSPSASHERAAGFPSIPPRVMVPPQNYGAPHNFGAPPPQNYGGGYPGQYPQGGNQRATKPPTGFQ